MVTRRFIKASDKVRAAGTGRAGAYGEATSQFGLPRRGERRSLLMPDVDPFDLAAANRIAQWVERVPDQAEDLLDPDLFKHGDQSIRHHLRHLSLLHCCEDKPDSCMISWQAHRHPQLLQAQRPYDLSHTASASRIRFVIESGCEISAKWLASISIVFAPIRLAMKRCRSGLIVRSWVDTA